MKALTLGLFTQIGPLEIAVLLGLVALIVVLLVLRNKKKP